MIDCYINEAMRDFKQAGCNYVFAYVHTDYDHTKLKESYTVKGLDYINKKLYLKNITQDINGNTYVDEVKILPMPLNDKIDYFERRARKIMPALNLLIDEIKTQKPCVFKKNKTPYNRLIKIRGLIQNALAKSCYCRK